MIGVTAAGWPSCRAPASSRRSGCLIRPTKRCATCGERARRSGHELKARQHLQAFLLRHGRRYPGKTTWTKNHEGWIAQQRFDHDADRIVLTEYQLAAQAAEQRVQRLTAALTDAAQAGALNPWWPHCAHCAASTRSVRSGWSLRSATSPLQQPPSVDGASSGLVLFQHSSGSSIRRASDYQHGQCATPGDCSPRPHGSHRFPRRHTKSQQLRQRSVSLPSRCATTPGKRSSACAEASRLSLRGVQREICAAVARELAGLRRGRSPIRRTTAEQHQILVALALRNRRLATASDAALRRSAHQVETRKCVAMRPSSPA